jgi:hypothetical protein
VHAAVVTKTSFLEAFGAFPQPVPGVFFVFAHVLFEHNTEKKLHGFEAGVIHMFRGGKHGADFHVESPKTLIAVTQSSVNKSDFVAHSSSGESFNSVYYLYKVLDIRSMDVRNSQGMREAGTTREC